jgi:diphosphomevalonate decarboxylase
MLARLGSGSACRSIPDGFVEWIKGTNHETSYAHTLFNPDYLSISIIAVILQEQEKKTGSTLGMKDVHNSIFFKVRIKNLRKKLKELKHALKTKDYDSIFQLSEKEALELHAMVMTTPPCTNIYWAPDTIKLINFVWDMRDKNIPVYFTIDAGQNVFLLCEQKYEKDLLKKLKSEKYIKKIIINKPSIGAKIINEHLF